MKNNITKNFTKVNNDILEHIVKFKFNGTQLRIILVIWRYTYGFQRSSHSISLNFIANSIQVDKTRVKKELKALILANVILVVKEAISNQPRVVAFNTNYNDWEVAQSGSKNSREANLITGLVKDHPTGAEDTPSLGDEIVPQEIKQKDKDKERIYIPLFKHWNSKKIIIHRSLNSKRKSAIEKRLKDGYAITEIYTAINNYSNILESRKHYYTYKFNLEDFLNPKNLDRFLDVNNPFSSLLKSEYSKEDINEKSKESSTQYDELF